MSKGAQAELVTGKMQTEILKKIFLGLNVWVSHVLMYYFCNPFNQLIRVLFHQSVTTTDKLHRFMILKCLDTLICCQ